MKKFSLGIMVLFVTAAWLAAQSGTITSPKANDVWDFGAKEMVQWTFSGNAAVKLLLYDAAGKKLGPIKSGQLSDGSFLWTVGTLESGKMVAAAKNYSLQLVQTDAGSIVLHKYAGPFEIAPVPATPIPPPPPGNPPANMIVLNRSSRINPGLITPTLRVSQPAAGAVLNPGDTFPIAWSLVGGGYNEVKIMMYPAGQPHLARAGQVRWIAQSAPNSGVFSWKLEANERTGKHVVRVQTPDGKIFGDSGVFTIGSEPVLTTVRVRAPDIKTMLADQAAIAIQLLDFQMSGPGELKFVSMLVKVNSGSGFVLTPAMGHPQYGSLYARCVIEVPNTDKSGNFTATKVLDAIYSLKGAPPFKLIAQPTQIGWGDTTFNADFDPDCHGQAQGQKVVQKQHSGPFEGGKLCIREYYPKLTVTLHLVTRNGEAVAEKSVYIHYDADQWPMGSVFLPGEVNSCSKGVQKW